MPSLVFQRLPRWLWLLCASDWMSLHRPIQTAKERIVNFLSLDIFNLIHLLFSLKFRNYLWKRKNQSKNLIRNVFPYSLLEQLICFDWFDFCLMYEINKNSNQANFVHLWNSLMVHSKTNQSQCRLMIRALHGILP